MSSGSGLICARLRPHYGAGFRTALPGPAWKSDRPHAGPRTRGRERRTHAPPPGSGRASRPRGAPRTGARGESGGVARDVVLERVSQRDEVREGAVVAAALEGEADVDAQRPDRREIADAEAGAVADVVEADVAARSVDVAGVDEY